MSPISMLASPEPENDICYFAMTNFRGQKRKFGIKTDDRRRHMYLIGKTGMGKSTTMENMIIQDIRDGKGVGVVDPHGDLAEKIMDYIPSHRVNDIVYFNPADIEYPIAFNILENVDSQYKHLVASGLMGVFTKIWANVWSARMEYIMNNCILALLDSPGNTLLGINRLLVDKDYRRKIVMRITDPVVRSFWVNEYANYNDRFRTEAIAPIQNKVGQFLSTAIVRNIVGQSKSTIDMREIMDSGKILIMNLSKGRIGEDNSALLGAMMITKLQLAAMSRVDVPEHERRDFVLYVDEFQNFATQAFANILSEARKYRLSLVLAHQYIEQLDETVAAAVFGNVGTIVCFRIGASDAEELVKEFSPVFTEEDLVNLTKYDIYLRLMINGVASRPFSASSLPPLKQEEKTGNHEKVIAVSRERYARAREEVEEKIIRWTDVESMERETAAVAAAEQVPEEEERYQAPRPSRAPAAAPLPPQTPPHTIVSHPAPIAQHVSAASIPPPVATEPALEKNNGPEPKQATCDNCGRGTLVTFEPDEKRNVFCKSCLKKFKKGLIDASTLPKRNILEKYDNLPSLLPRTQTSSKSEIVVDRELPLPPHTETQIGKKDRDASAPSSSHHVAPSPPPPTLPPPPVRSIDPKHVNRTIKSATTLPRGRSLNNDPADDRADQRDRRATLEPSRIKLDSSGQPRGVHASTPPPSLTLAEAITMKPITFSHATPRSLPRESPPMTPTGTTRRALPPSETHTKTTAGIGNTDQPSSIPHTLISPSTNISSQPNERTPSSPPPPPLSAPPATSPDPSSPTLRASPIRGLRPGIVIDLSHPYRPSPSMPNHSSRETP